MKMPLPCWENCYHHPAIMIRVRKKVSFIFLLLLFFSILYPSHLWQVDRWNINKLKVKLNLFRKRKNHTKLVKNIHIYNEFLFNIFRMEYYYSHPIKSILLKTAKISYLPFSCFFFLRPWTFFFLLPNMLCIPDYHFNGKIGQIVLGKTHSFNWWHYLFLPRTHMRNV